MSSILQCPVCGEPLSRSEADYRCKNNHSFDIARQGYVNLLLSHKKRSKEPGDSPEMIQSRRKFLDKGFYNQLSLRINEVLASEIYEFSSLYPITILDAGCGEGFYIKSLKDYLAKQNNLGRSFEYYGIDISKFAIRQATQRDKAITWIVASITDLPFLTSSLDVIFSIFTILDFKEFSRVLKQHGKLIIVTPGPDHLLGLREIIYTEVKQYGMTDIISQSTGFFSHSSTTRVTYEIKLERPEEIMNLLAMTPFFWNISLNTRSKVEALERLDTGVDFLINVFEKLT